MSDELELFVVVDEDGEEYEYDLDAVQVDDDGAEFIEVEDDAGLVAFEIVLGDEIEDDEDEDCDEDEDEDA